MELWKFPSSNGASSTSKAPLNFSKMVVDKAQYEQQEGLAGHTVKKDVHVDHREVYFLIMHFLSSGPCQRTFGQLRDELLEHHELLPRRYHAWYSRSGASSGIDSDDGISLPLGYNTLVERYPDIGSDHLVKLLKQLLLHIASPVQSKVEGKLNAADVPTLMGSGSFSLLDYDRSTYKQVKTLPKHLRWPHMQSDQVHGLSLREIGGGFSKHHRAPSIRSACYAIAKPSTMVQKMDDKRRIRGHRNAVYCAIFDRSGRYVITGSDDRLVKIWSMETAFCLASCRGHEGDITDLAVNLNNALVASASNDFVIRVWRLPDGLPISVLRGHTGAVTAIAFSPRPIAQFQLLSSSDDGTCRIWDVRFSQFSPRIYVPKPSEAVTGKSCGPPSNGPSSSNGLQSNQILCCAYNATGTVFVTGSSDTYARVWSACRSNTEEPGQPIHEMDLLAGHENDVNYVQFSGCAVTSRSSMFDTLKEDSVPKFKNSWYSHDNIVTCSRDGSAIIWAPKSRRSHGKFMRWTKSYHLKVPPPPLPPQPPRGGPRQRILPTPRGVNMIVWSLDNRFVLAAIMDCRICVWNAGDGSLVHSLTGHTQSSYVLDVHPFNPRIAMSAGYDGKTIIWDIWEGIPIRTFVIGPYKLVDGKFSQDGTSIVLSDDVGQIYLLNTGQGESQNDAKYDQFFLGDYRPLIRDTAGNVLDQETQLVPYRRNMQDLICDSSMIPYPEPYQTMFQQRRLGALGHEWHPSSIKFAVGPDISLGVDFQMPLLEDFDRMVIEPLPEFTDAIYWEPENEIVSDDTDSEYNVAEECASEGEHGSLCYSCSSDSGCSEESDVEHSQKDGLRRSRRRKHKTEVDLMTSSGRRAKKRSLNDRDSLISGNHGAKKLKGGRKVSKRMSSKAKLSRPQRVAARNALNMFSKISGTSTDGDDEDDSEDSMSSNDSELQDSNIQCSKSDRYLQNTMEKQFAAVDARDTAKTPELSESQLEGANRKKLVFKISLRDSKKPFSSEDSRTNDENQGAVMNPSSMLPQETRINIKSKDSGSSSVNVSGVEVCQNQIEVDVTEREHPIKIEDHMLDHADENGSKIRWGEIKIRTPNHSRLGEEMPGDESIEPRASFGAYKENMNDHNRGDEQLGTNSLHDHDVAKSSQLCDLQYNNGASSACHNISTGGTEEDWSEFDKCRHSDLLEVKEASSIGHSLELKEKSPPKIPRLRIKTRGILMDPINPSKLKFIRAVDDLGSDVGDTKSEGPSYMGQKHILGRPENNQSFSVYDIHEREKSEKGGADLISIHDAIKENISNAVDSHPSEFGFSEAATDAVRRTRSIRMKATSREPSSVIHNFRVKGGPELVETSKNLGNDVQFEERMSSSKLVVRSRSDRDRLGGYYDSDQLFLAGKKSNDPVRKLSWLILSKHEEAYRYIPQQGDEVVYLRQGHQEYIEKFCSREKGPWSSIRGYMRAVELCKVENLDYATVPGSGDSCCKITLRFIDSSSKVFGKAFKFTLPELTYFPDFVVEKTRYDEAISRNWTHSDKCWVWWNENGDDGNWWEGTIESSQAKSEEFPDSPWERYSVRYDNARPGEENQLHSPWELHDSCIPWKHPCIDYEIRNKLLSSFAKLERSVNGNQDNYGIQKFNEASKKLDFFNRFPVPLYPEVIVARLQNNYYRTLEAVGHDIHVMMENARAYFSKNVAVLKKMERLSDWYARKLSA